jgi:hypothetical protein
MNDVDNEQVKHSKSLKMRLITLVDVSKCNLTKYF